MLTSLILQLQAPAEANLPANLGRAGQSLLLRLIGGREPALAQELHQAERARPYTVSNLVLGKRAGGSLHAQAGQSGWLRFTGLTEAVSRHLLALAQQPPESVELDGYQFQVSGATLDPAVHPWAGQITYQDLAAPYLLGGRASPGSTLRLEFASPTTFRSQGRFLPLPQPELVFGSLLDRWQTFAPIALHPDTRRFAAEAVVLSRYELRTRGMPYVKAGTRGGGEARSGGEQAGHYPTIIGFTGRVIFAVLNRDRYWLNVLHLLAAFAFYSGVGYQTAAGLGQVRQI
ncbi:MAG: CRISPR-associated protein Cas6 [Anaerolineae bacterium]|nr:CRISPR system precrRNA processing endoribonuclease RAMP protein Cas6 [Anaerolineales bacterium]MCQ3980047.1 CRISPR-associated protein Cas6 [Anaerolineae bacterium]